MRKTDFFTFPFPHGGGAGLFTQLLSPYPPRQRSPTTSAMRSPAEIGVLSVKFELSHEKDRYFCKLWKTTQERKKWLMLPERELFLCQDASRSHLLSTSKTLLLPQLLCRTTKQRYATTCLGKIKWLSVRRGIRSPMELQYSDFPKLSDYKKMQPNVFRFLRSNQSKYSRRQITVIFLLLNRNKLMIAQ